MNMGSCFQCSLLVRDEYRPTGVGTDYGGGRYLRSLMSQKFTSSKMGWTGIEKRKKERKNRDYSTWKRICGFTETCCPAAIWEHARAEGFRRQEWCWCLTYLDRAKWRLRGLDWAAQRGVQLAQRERNLEQTGELYTLSETEVIVWTRRHSTIPWITTVTRDIMEWWSDGVMEWWQQRHNDVKEYTEGTCTWSVGSDICVTRY